MEKKTVTVIDASDLETFIQDQCEDEDGEHLVFAAFPEASNDTYWRLYLKANAICPSPLEPYLDALKAELGVDEPYVLVRFSW